MYSFKKMVKFKELKLLLDAQQDKQIYFLLKQPMVYLVWLLKEILNF